MRLILSIDMNYIGILEASSPLLARLLQGTISVIEGRASFLDATFLIQETHVMACRKEPSSSARRNVHVSIWTHQYLIWKIYRVTPLYTIIQQPKTQVVYIHLSNYLLRRFCIFIN
jgi:hypothetical protein